MSMNIKKHISNIIKYGSLILWTLVIILPLITVFFGSFKTPEEFIETIGVIPPKSFLYFENYVTAFTKGKMLIGFMNTAIIMFVGIFGSILVGSMVAYIISRFDFKYKKLVLFLYLFISIVPLEISQVATFKIINILGLYNTRLAPIVLYLGADVLMVYMYIQNLEKIPIELDKAAMLEGASYIQIFKKIILPLTKPATATVILLKSIAIYNDFYIPFLYMPGENMNTISTTLFRFMGVYMREWHVICAALVISMVPMLILFFVLQKYIYKGMTEGSVI